MRFRNYAAALAALLFCAGAANAQDTRPIRARDAVPLNVRDVHQLVAQLRPDWLLLGGDPADPASRDRVRVYVGRTLAGGLEALHGMTTTNLHSVELAGPARARQLDRRGWNVAAVVLVRYEDPNVTQAPSRRIQVTAGLGGRGLLDERTIETLREAGFASAHSDIAWTPPRANTSFTLYGGVAVPLRGDMGVGVNGYHTSKTTARGIRSSATTGRAVAALTNRFTTTDLAAVAFAGTRHVRLGLGPAVRLLEWEQGLGGNGQGDLQTGSETVLGAAADVSLTLPPASRFHLHVTAGGRWFPAHTIPGRSGAPETDLGGLTTYTSIGVGFGLF